ncbi:hypothetical protein BY458DRAFT_76224 [Sporodiniella umbellata]|nr:hypothetical protein BY458DRAFT_76224 [Sporodiniella umbellata]
MSIYWFKIKNNRNTSSKLVFISCSQNERVFGYLHSKIRRLFDFPHHCKFRLGFKNSEGKFAFINSSNQLLRILPNDDTRFPETSSHRQIALTVIPINFQELYEERFELDPNFVPIKPSQDARKSQSEDRDEQNSRHQRIFSSLKKLNEMIEAYHKETDSHMKSIEKEIKIAHCSSIKKIDTVHSTLKESENYFQAMTEEIKNDIKEHVTKTNDHVAPVDSLLKPNISLSDKKKVGLQQSDSLCNQCFCYITGKKWTCDTCDDFDLCLSCQTKIQHYPGHSLKCQKIAEKTNSVQCRNCCLNIPDSRYFCKGCPDFNVCLLCIQIVLKSHDTSHMFVLQDALSIHTTEYTYNNTLHTPTECNNCKETIYGIKYKCVTCNSYYLCEFCEILSDMFHSKYLLRHQ